LRGKGHQITPGQGCGRVYRNDALIKPLWEIYCKPFCQCLAFSAGIHEGNTATNFSDRHHADEASVFIEPVKPFQNASIRTWPCHLGQDIGVEKQSHRGKSRGSSR
jgi:hypothetical protein